MRNIFKSTKMIIGTCLASLVLSRSGVVIAETQYTVTGQI